MVDLKPNPYGPYIVDGGPGKIPADEVAILVPKYDTSKPDATGAFHPESINFSDFWTLDKDKIVYVNNRLPKSCHRPGNVAEELLKQMREVQGRSSKPIAVWVFFCHGYTHGLQFSIRSPNHPQFDSKYREAYEEFLNIISEHPSPLLALYACSTGDDPDGDPDSAPGSGDDSFADCVRDDLCKRGAIYSRVFAHTTAGHTSCNPMIKFFDGDGLPSGAEGAKLIAQPGSKEFRNLRTLLKTDFRFKVPFMTQVSVRDLL